MGMGFPMGMESHGIPMGMGIGDKIGNGNGKEWFLRKSKIKTYNFLNYYFSGFCTIKMHT